MTMMYPKNVMYMVGGSMTTSIRLSKETRDRIANFGKAGESLETALIRALTIAEECEKKRIAKSLDST